MRWRSPSWPASRGPTWSSLARRPERSSIPTSALSICGCPRRIWKCSRSSVNPRRSTGRPAPGSPGIETSTEEARVAKIAITAVDSETGYAQRIKAGLHDLKADEPVSAGGTNTGPTPYALLLAALGACTSITLRMYAERKGWRLGHIHVELRHDKSDDGADRIGRQIRFAAPLTEDQRRLLAEVVERTPLTKTIKAGSPIQTRLL